MITAEEFAAQMQEIEGLVADLSHRAGDRAAMQAARLLQAMNRLYGAGLQRMLSLTSAAGEARGCLLEQFAQDDLVRTMLLLHGLHPVDLRTRLGEALAHLRPLLENYGGRVQIVEIDSESVTLRLETTPTSGPSPSAMLRELIEHAVLAAAPDAGRVVFAEYPASAACLQLPIVQV